MDNFLLEPIIEASQALWLHLDIENLKLQDVGGVAILFVFVLLDRRETG